MPQCSGPCRKLLLIETGNTCFLIICSTFEQLYTYSTKAVHMFINRMQWLKICLHLVEKKSNQ